ncbi:PREDICTED: HEAT repeat-containing protein 1 [Papilio xuthus]|uniref:HEAT repeat-containing protein 1 n=1 Tax=Papilio xuthus TaxID=66420 RepID=A0AAJ6ZXW5_PAPXU|nr:PREDICTED: HEAT repeat-containing protein 1 [Papilio xuthus]
MASTSLAEQLQKLAAPQSSIYKDDKKKASLLFDPREAALKDRETFYEIGVSGLKELTALFEGFRVYEDSLFSVSSKDFERAIQTKEVNHNLDQTIEKFLLQLSPYFLLQPSHKALEWLVNRYHIHEYNQDAIMMLILPYHETKIFIRFLQLLAIKGNTNRWNWLRSVQKKGVPLTKQTLHNQCVSNTGTLQFIAKMILKYVKVYGERATQLNTVFGFFAITAFGVIDTMKSVNEAFINALLPTIMKGFESTVQDFRAASYTIYGFICMNSTLKRKTLNEILECLLSTDDDLSYESVLLIVMTFKYQKHLTKFSAEMLNNISGNVMSNLCKHLQFLSTKKKNNIQSLVLAFLLRVLPTIQKDIEEFKRFSELPEILIDEVDLKDQDPETIIRCVLTAFKPPQNTRPNVDDGSDIEIIDEDVDMNPSIFNWYSIFLKNIERKYPDSFDKVVKSIMSSDSDISTVRRSQLSKLLGFKPAVAHKISGAYLFENLNHVNPELRTEAVNYIAKEFQALKVENAEFVKESIVNRLNDDNSDVVLATLDISNECLREVLNDIDLTNTFVNIITNKSKKWKNVTEKAIVKFCALDSMPVNQETVLALIPYLFPYDQKSAKITWKIITSQWGKKFGLFKKITGANDSIADNFEILNQMIYKVIFIDNAISFDDYLDLNLINQENTLEVHLYMLLKSCSSKSASTEDLMSTLKMLLKSIETRIIVSTLERKSFSSEIIPEFIKISKQNKIVFEVMEYIFKRFIEELNVKYISKPWCNVCETPETVFVRKLYELFLTGCGIPTYGDNYVVLLKMLLRKLFDNSRDKFNFVANIACGHVLFATDPEDVINPELQLRSLKLLINYITIEGNSKWIYDSDVLIVTILFNLNNPLTAIRECIIDLINKMLRYDPDKNLIYVQLIKELLAHKDELLIDPEQIQQVLKTILTHQTPGNKMFRKNCLLKLTSILIADTPSYIKCNLVKILASVNNANSYPNLIPSLNSLEKVLKQTDRKIVFDIYESNLFRLVYSFINEATVTTFAKEQIWKSIEIGLKEYRECILDENQVMTSPCMLIMKEFDENVFKKFPEEKTKDFIRLVASAGAFSGNPNISSAASKLMKKIHLDFNDFKPIFERMLNAVDPAANVSKKKKVSVPMLSYQLVETDEWRLGVTMLEYVQNKKKMNVDNSFVSILFQLLNKCLRFEEQSYVEYTKQLILSSLWYYCKKFVNDTDKDQQNSLKSMFDVELVVQCIRGTQNPQTQHHALILLSHAAYMLPEQVLHHTMEIFTFMGSSVLRHDDAYSFQIITKIIETLIPIIVKLDRDIEDYSDKEIQKLQKRVVPVLRIFADVVLHVPEHRRLPMYKKLIETLGSSQFLWVFLALLLETHIAHFNENKKKDKVSQRTLADQESPVTRLDFGQSILLEFPPEVCLENFIKLMIYIKSLPVQKDENSMDTDVDPGDIFSVNGHTPIQLRHYKYVIITFMNTCLASSRFIQHSSQTTDDKVMEERYKSFIINILTFIQTISKITDDKAAKYWRVMLHHSYDLLDHTNNLLSAPMFLSVVRGLLKYTLQTVRRKSMELLNSKIQFNPEMFVDVDKELLFSLLPALLDIVKTIDTNNDSLSEIAAQELELNQQTALLSLKLLARMLAADNPEPFKPVLEIVTDYTCNPNISSNVMASVVLCLAELCGNLKAHALVSLRKFMPALIKVLKKQRKSDVQELVLLSTVTAISKIVESLPLFLSPYLLKILYEYSILFAKWDGYDQECSKVSTIVSKLGNIKKKIASSIPPRVLIPIANATYNIIIEKENYSAVAPVMSVLADSFGNVTAADFTALQQDLTSFFLSALQLRSDAVDKDVDADVIDKAEDEVVNALVSLVLKLSETNFRPFYFKIYDWAVRTNIDGHKDRTITFYRLSSAIADKLKGLFVLFAGHFIKNAAELLDACNNSKNEELFFDSEEKCTSLVNYIIKTLHVVFLYDSQSFINKDRFETLMQPVVDQLENTIGGIDNLKTRAAELIIPCIGQFAVATADDSLWKLLNYQVLLKTRHNDAEIRLTALDCLVAMATQLGSSWLPLLAESVPFLAELLEDGDPKIENSTKEAIRKLEQILGEPLEKYF